MHAGLSTARLGSGLVMAASPQAKTRRQRQRERETETERERERARERERDRERERKRHTHTHKATYSSSIHRDCGPRAVPHEAVAHGCTSTVLDEATGPTTVLSTKHQPALSIGGRRKSPGPRPRPILCDFCKNHSCSTSGRPRCCFCYSVRPICPIGSLNEIRSDRC